MKFHNTFENPEASLFMLSLNTSFPILHMLNNNLSRALRAMLSTYGFDKITFGVCLAISHTTTMVSKIRPTHQIEINTMIHQIIHPRLHTFRCTEIYPIFLTYILDLLPCPRQTYKTWMKFGEIMLQDSRCVSGRVTTDEDW